MMRMDFKQIFELTWEQSKNNIVPLLILSLLFVVISTITFGILAPVAMAGFYHSIDRMVKEGRTPDAKDIFSQIGLILPLLGFSIATFIILFIGYSLFVLPGLIMSLALAFFSLYMIPLMVDKGFGVIAAFKESCAMSLRGALTDHLIVLLVFIGANLIGGSFYIGVIVTTPLTCVFLFNVYEHKLANQFIVDK
nr:hypothetical protein [uncultured Desulfobacter sp.]